MASLYSTSIFGSPLSKASVQNKSLDINAQASIANAARYAEMNNINLNNNRFLNEKLLPTLSIRNAGFLLNER